MIFISYTHADQELVRHFSSKIADAYGRKNVFYDEWAIQPGDGIIDKMSEGLDSANFFFFFVTEASLKSNMVKLEWQNALYRAAKGHDIKFISVRVQPCEMPSVLAQSCYIDAYTVGIDVALRQMYDIIEGRNTYVAPNKPFCNLLCEVHWKSASDCNVIFHPIYFMEPTSQYIIAIENAIADVEFEVTSDSIFMQNGGEGRLDDTIRCNWLCFSVSRATTPDNPMMLRLHTKSGEGLRILATFHQTGPQKHVLLPMSQTSPFMPNGEGGA
ncbi:MAG: toll/interleukin-1 receptor domain-containing protein [Clostridiales bacterium]|nr:toll/interleukin-1 receptor domain-containing protein [Clostridiales bacterium]